MKTIFTIAFSLFVSLSFAQWPNSVDKKLTIEQTNDYKVISKIEQDETENTFLVMKQGRFVSKSSPLDTYFVENYFQKLDKAGNPQWNLDSTKIICNTYKMISDNEGGLYILYDKNYFVNGDYHFQSVQQNCVHINKNGVKVWTTILDKFVSVLNSESGQIISIDLDTNQLPIVYTFRNGFYRVQKIDKNGKLIDDKTLGQKLNLTGVSTSYYKKSKSFINANDTYNNNGKYEKTLLSRKDVNWNEIWKNEFILSQSKSYFADQTDNLFFVQSNSDGNSKSLFLLTKIASNGELVFNNVKLSTVSYSDYSDYKFFFDSQNNLNLYLINSEQIIYSKVSPTGELLMSKTLDDVFDKIKIAKNIIVERGAYGYGSETNYNLSIDKDGNILLNWVKNGENLQELFISKFDSEGKMLWKEDKLVGRDSTIISVRSSTFADNKISTFYSAGKFPSNIPIHTTNFYVKRLTENGNFNEIKADIPTKICTNDTINVKIQTEGTYEKDNQYKVLLSDAKGDFSNSTQIALSKETEFKIPKIENVIAGNYKVKVVSSNPVVEILNAIDLKVSNVPTLALTQTEKVYKNDSTLIKFDMIGEVPFKLKLWDDKEFTDTSNTFERYLKPTYSGDYYIKSFSDANCFAGSLGFKITILEALATENQNNFVRIYPNNQTQTLELFLSENTSNDFYVAMYSTRGEVLFEKSEKVERIDLKALSQGIYILKGFYNGKYFTKKFLLEK